MTKLDDKLPTLYKELHANGAFQGLSCRDHVQDFKSFLTFRKSGAVLDYGCGPLGGIKGHVPSTVIPYDPYVPEFSADPWEKKFDVFFSSDVFEHIPEQQLYGLLRRLCKHRQIKLIFLVISTRHANKTFSNGVNVHLTVRSAEWWHGFLVGVLGLHFVPELIKVDGMNATCTFGFHRKEEDE
jgi:hypothetical protein